MAISQIIHLPKTYLALGDEIKIGMMKGHHPIVYSEQGDPGIHGGRIVGYVTKEGYKAMCDACQAYNDDRNAPLDAA